MTPYAVAVAIDAAIAAATAWRVIPALRAHRRRYKQTGHRT